MSTDLETQNKILVTKLEQMKIEIAKLKYQNQRLKEDNILINKRLEQLEQGYVTKMIFEKAIASIVNSIESLKIINTEESHSEDSIDTTDLFLGNLFQQISDERELEIFEERTNQKNNTGAIEFDINDGRPILTNETIILSLNDSH